MRSILKIAQVTDIHIDETNEPSHGVDDREQFKAVLNRVSEFRPDLLVLSGDLSRNAEGLQAYNWIKTQLDTCSFDYAIIPGNC